MSALGRNLTLPFDFYNTKQQPSAAHRERQAKYRAMRDDCRHEQLLQLQNC